MFRKNHNHKLQTYLWCRKEEPHETPGGKTKQSNQRFLPYRDDCKARTGTK